ncbi:MULTISPECIES: hypothetical protein [unclassified Exiguobacterium]|uniref:hypothetical protein n=2 Tax=Exiguobacterium TaxID=33986 RepID=UPI002036677A|nr:MULTISPECIES: hypothetical protein [unclassified Exiguobacterium]
MKRYALRAESGTTLLEISMVLWLSPLLLLGLLTMTQLVSNANQTEWMEEDLFFHTVERLMWRSIECGLVGEELRGRDVDPGEEPIKWRLVRVQNQIRLKKEFGGELTYAHDVTHYRIKEDGARIVIELNQRSRTYACKKPGSS